MIDLVKKTLLAGVGVAALTKDKVEELARDFVEKGKMTEQEGRVLVEELLVKSDEARSDLQQQIERSLATALEKMDLARKGELDALKIEVQELRQALENKTE
jgi:polyhydroxyalkanoate synthesis regulator phasin